MSRFVADLFEGFVLDHAEKLRLERQGQVPDLVKKYRTLVGGLESTLAVAHGVGKCALYVAEEFAFKESFRQGGAIHPDERTVDAIAFQVQLLGEQFLPYPAFPEYQHRGIGFCDAFHDVELFEDDRAPGYHGVVAAVRDDLVLEYDDLVARSLQEAGVLVGNRRLVCEHLEHFEVFLTETEFLALVQYFDDTDALVPDAHRYGEHVLGLVTGGLLDRRAEAGIVRYVVDNEALVVFRNPAGYALVHLDDEFFRLESFRAEGDFEAERFFAGINEKKGGSLPLYKTHCRFEYMNQQYVYVGIIGIDEGVDLDEGIEFICINSIGQFHQHRSSKSDI